MSPLFSLAPGLALVLASASPRRRELLERWGVPFSIRTAHDEEPRPGADEAPDAYVRRAALAKARAVREQLSPAEQAASLVLAADTIVCLDGVILGKPRDAAHALTMLKRLNGRAHQVFSAVALCAPGQWPGPAEDSLSDVATVVFATWPADVLAAYARGGEPADKAGAYAVQGQGAFLVRRVEGSWTTVVGLPLTPLAQRMLQRGFMRACAPETPCGGAPAEG